MIKIDDIKDIKSEVQHPFAVVKETGTKSEFMPCPFCGSTKIIVKEEFFLYPHDPIGAYCMCGNCYSKTALCYDKEAAVKVLNIRAKAMSGNLPQHENEPNQAETCLNLATEASYKQVTSKLDRPRGEWIKTPGMNEKCSVCGNYFPVSEFATRPFEINFCPQCGADMRNEQ